MISHRSINQTGTPKYQAIAAELAQAILNGQLAAGEKLPPHRVLAKRLGVTTGTVSRAYASLEQQALAQARVGDGTYVRNLDRGAADPAQVSAAAYIDMAQNVAIATEEAPALLRALATLGRSGANLNEVLKYQPEAGAQRHRIAGAAWLARFGTSGAWNRVMVTHGAQHAIAGVLRTIARPGDTLLTESLSYPGMLALARSMRLQVIGVEMDAQGLLPETWRAGPFAVALRQTGVLVRTMDHFAVGRTPTPHAVRISLNKPASIEQLRSGLQTIAAVLNDPPPALMDP